ncbi:MAG: lycopene cyclase family protein [Candidatus Kerfeldbacteria bacterium]
MNRNNTPTQDSYDVVVLGAGIAGLLLASEISKQYSTLVVEKGLSPPKTKYWLTTKDAVKGNPDLDDESLISRKFDSFFIADSQQRNRQVRGGYYLWDTNKLVDFLCDKISKNGGHFLMNHKYYSRRYESDNIVVSVNQRDISAKVVVDCMGFNSPIIGANSMVDIIGYHTVCGATVPTIKEVDPVAFCNLVESGHAHYLEIFPTNEKTAHVVMIASSEEPYPFDKLLPEFLFAVENSRWSQYFKGTSSEMLPLHGVIPVGTRMKTGINRVFIYGEGAQVHPASTAAGLTQILQSYRRVAKELGSRIQSNQLGGKSLEGISVDNMSRFCSRIHRSVFGDYMGWTSTGFSKLVNQMGSLSDDVLNGMLFGDLVAGDVFSFENLYRLIRSRNTILLRHGFRALLPGN